MSYEIKMSYSFFEEKNNILYIFRLQLNMPHYHPMRFGVSAKMPSRGTGYISYLVVAWAAGVLILIILLRRANDDCCHQAGEWTRLLRIFSSHHKHDEDSNTMFTKSYIERYIRKHTNVTISYDGFVFPEPHFVDPNDELLFYKNVKNLEEMKFPPEDKLIGKIEVIRNGTIHETYDCGWQMDNTVFTARIKRQIRRKYDILCPLLVPQSNSFQHFIDGVIPKLIQARQILELPNITLLMYRPWDRIIEDLLEALNLPRSRIQYYDGGFLSSNYLISTCITPPVHPELWQKARMDIVGSDTLQVPMKDTHVVFLTRAKSRNPGRLIVNFDEVVAYLLSRYGDKLVVFKGGYNFKESVSIFSKARLLIGVHGGAFYNLLFCPSDTHIVEILPTDNNGEYVPEILAHNIVWKMSSMLQQSYWRLSELPVNDRGNVNINIKKLGKVLDRVDDIQT